MRCNQIIDNLPSDLLFPPIGCFAGGHVRKKIVATLWGNTLDFGVTINVVLDLWRAWDGATLNSASIQ